MGLAVGAGAVALAWALSGGGGGGNASALRGHVRLRFEPGPPRAAQLLQRSGAFARAVRTVNYEIDLPTDLRVVVGAAEGPVYDPPTRTVSIPWSFVEESRADLERLSLLKGATPKTLDRIQTAANVFVLYHELAHGLIDILDVPVVSSEEQTADSFATIFAIASQRGGDVIPLSAAGLAEARQERQGAPTLSDFADDHGFDRQRAFAEVCLVYGSAPTRFQDLVRRGFVPADRAQLCVFDYRRTLRSWRRLLTPWLTHTGGLLPLPSAA